MGSAPPLPTQAERARERDVFPFYPLSLDIPDLSSALAASPHCLPPPGHRPRPSRDAVLSAIAQLAALRLGVQRALVSLIDSRSQTVLAEATRTLSLCLADDDSDGLWLGCATIPRECGLCELVLDAGGSAVVINDVQNDTRCAAVVQRTRSLRFYAGVPLVTQTGSMIGAVGVFDHVPRNGLAPHLVRALHDVAAAAMAHLNASRALDDNRRSERLVRGLTSFVTGASDLQRRADLNVPRSPPNPTALSPLPHPSNVPVLERPVVSRNPSAELHPPATADQEPPGDKDELLALQDMILPRGAKRMFSRAANIMRDSGGFAGVIIFDASLANAGDSPASTPSSSPASTPRDLSNAAASPVLCKMLGFADVEESSRTGTSPKSRYLRLAELELKRLLNQNPHGKIFTFAPSPNGEQNPRPRARFSAAAAIMDVAPDARSAAVVPLWDYQRQRWFAGCLCWTTDARRLLSHGSDLLYLRAFGNSITTELSRLDSLSVDRAKSTFIESMSHELRSPLHGILGGTEYLRGTQLDAAQNSIVASIGVCGRTLLDTVRNVLEYSKINERSSSHPASNSSTPTVDVRQLTEETVEAVFAGHSYSVSSAQDDDPFAPSSPTGAPVRRAIRIILDMAENRPWHFALQPGIWRRVVMNVFGNALKFTHTGFVRVALSATDVDESEARICLTVADSGPGISPRFLRDGLFKPFSQENPFVPGTGLGLSIVRRLVDGLGGSVDVQSRPNAGTEINITATLRKRPCRRENVISAVVASLRGRRVCVPDGPIADNPPCVLRGERYFVQSITETLCELFGLRVSSDADPDDDQLVVYPGPNMQSMSKPRPHQAMSVVVALDALEAATLRADARIAGGCIEIVTQPCGPYKLARILERYLNRQAAAASQTAVLPSTTTTTAVDPARPPPPSPQRPWPLSRLPTFRPTPPTPDDHPASSPPLPPPPRRASTPLLSSCTSSCTSTSATIIPHHHRHQHPPSPPSSSPSSPPSSFPPKPRSRSTSSASTSPHRHRHRHRCQATAAAAADILIVDDNPLNVRLLSAFLTKHGFAQRHASAANGLEALRLFKAEPRRWAAILMDLSMPVMDGATATREIRAWEKRLSLLAAAAAAAAAAERVEGEEGGEKEEEGGAEMLLLLGGDGGRRGKAVDGGGGGGGEKGEMGEGGGGAGGGGEGEERGSPSREEVVVVESAAADDDQQQYSTPLIHPHANTTSVQQQQQQQQQQQLDAGAGGVQIIVTTGLGSATARFEALSAGADEYMTKPIQFGALMKMLNKRIEDRAAAPGQRK